MPTAFARKLALFVLANAVAGCFALFSLDGYDDPIVTPSQLDDGGSRLGSDSAVDATPAPVGDAGTDGDASPVSGKLIFVTNDEISVGTPSPAGFVSVSDANTLCTEIAAKAGLRGQFLAWLSDQQGSAPGLPAGTDFPPPTPTGPEPFVTMDHRLVALSYADLRDAGPRVAIAVTETGTVLPDAPPPIDPNGPGPSDPRTAICPKDGLVWTGAGGEAAFNMNCLSWAQPSGEITGAAGRITKDPVGWVWSCNLSCALKARLYCFEL
jgi:hypothetical protein